MSVAVGAEEEVGLAEGTQGLGVMAGVARDPQPGFPSFPLAMRQEWKVGEQGKLGLVAGHSGVWSAGMVGELLLRRETRRTWVWRGTQIGPEPVWTSLNNCIRKMALS